MQTNFSENQLKDKDNQSTEKIFQKCVHCGMCNATCPTYGILGDELDGPRGRIYLIQDMLENERKPSKKVVKHIDRCLSCYSCMTTCPAGVNYMHVIDHGRKYIEKNYDRPLFDKILRNFLSKVLPNTQYFKLTSYLVKIGKLFKFLFPKKIKDMMELMPTSFPEKTIKVKEIYPANGKKIARVGKEDDANIDFINNIETWYEEHKKGNLDAILSNTSGCGTTLKDYGFIFRNDKKLKAKAKTVSELSKDVTEYLSENLKLNIQKKNKKYKIAYHSACSMQHGQKVHNEPISLLQKTDNDIMEIPNGHLCCGSAGTYNILQSEIAKNLLKDKVKNIESTNPQIISTGNIGCITQISNGTNIPILHTIELLDWYTGGPKPKILNKI